MASSKKEIIAAVHEFYSTIIRLPYIEADALILPPSDGWPGVNADELRKTGKTEEVIELLRYLPYLRNPSWDRKWMLSPDTLAIAYCDGEMYSPLMDELQPIPAHCIWLTTHDSRDGIDLLLDTQRGSITEWSMLERGVMVDYADYERTDKADRWMCYPTMPAVDFSKLWKARWEKLVWIPVYNPSGGPATALWWYRAIPGSDEEEYILVSDAEYEPTEDEDGSLGSGGSSVGSEVDECGASGNGDENASKTALSDREVDDILDDAFGEKRQMMRIKFTSEVEENADEIIPVSGLGSDAQTWNKMSPEQEADVMRFTQSSNVTAGQLILTASNA
ncbi:hypothetical protein F4782DRAFT_317654 [Xylaria castorea]|nr:hypothetical protein F4782DRAFT_317654 [Xylaria castorea]